MVLPARFFDAQTDIARPSGFAQIPRPFVIRADHLRETPLPADRPFVFAINIFDTRHLDRTTVTQALELLATWGLGPDRVPCQLGERTWAPLHFDLTAPVLSESSKLTLKFETPLELHANGKSVNLPEYATLMARLRDRISALNMFYGDSPLDLDFAHFTQIAKSVRLAHHNLTPQTTRRHSTRTGQWHPISGIIGTATYEGPWRSYQNWLRLGEYTGVGKQTSFGKGAFRIVDPPAME